MNKKGLIQIVSIIINGISFVCLFLLLFMACFFIYYIVENQIAKSKGVSPYISLYTIVSPSMEPTIKVYDVIFDKRITKEEELSIGDIITFYSDSIDTGGYTITHRIVDIIEVDGTNYYITKGDNNDKNDEGSITMDNIVGKVQFIIPALGKIQFFVSSIYGWLIIILVPALCLILIDLKKLLRVVGIKKQLEDIPKLKGVDEIEEKEENKKIRALIEEAHKLNRK